MGALPFYLEHVSIANLGYSVVLRMKQLPLLMILMPLDLISIFFIANGKVWFFKMCITKILLDSREAMIHLSNYLVVHRATKLKDFQCLI